MLAPTRERIHSPEECVNPVGNFLIPPMHPITARVDKLRRDKGLKQKALESLAGMKPNRLGKLKLKQYPPRPEEVVRLAQALAISPEWLTSENPSVPPPSPEGIATGEWTLEELGLLTWLRSRRITPRDVRDRMSENLSVEVESVDSTDPPAKPAPKAPRRKVSG